MKTINRQEIFDVAVRHLRKQGKKSLKPGSSSTCLYRGPNGLMCAFGPMIPDDKYDKTFEGQTASTVLTKLGYYLNIDDIDFVNDLQYIHDSHPVEKWKFYFKEFADQYNLVMP